MKLLRSSPHSRPFCLPLACLLALSACAPGTVGADAEPAPIEVPPPVEQTNEGLSIVYTDYGVEAKYMDIAITQYNLKNPDRPITAEKIFTDGLPESREKANQQMLAEIMAGEGPDLLFFTGRDMDIEKLARRGVFADLTPYFESDGFDWSDYNQTIMDAGVWDGHRLVIPLEYNFPILYTSQTALDETGFSVENCDTFDGFLDEVEKMQADSSQTRSVFRMKWTFYDFARYAGVPYVDYARQKADLSFPELRRSAQIYKNLDGIDIGYFDGDALAGAVAIRDGECLWIYPDPPAQGYLMGAGVINKFDDAVMMPIRDVNGGIQAEISLAVAVRNNSPNLQNAYDFIKYLLSEEYHLETRDIRNWDFSVLNTFNDSYYQHNTAERYNSMIPQPNRYGLEGDIVLPQEDYDELKSYMEQITAATYQCSQTDFSVLINDYLYGETSYADAIKPAESQLNIYLSE